MFYFSGLCWRAGLGLWDRSKATRTFVTEIKGVDEVRNLSVCSFIVPIQLPPKLSMFLIAEKYLMNPKVYDS